MIEQYIVPDKFGKSTINNIYFDTPDFLLIRRSIEKPVYKEKLRLRSYGAATPDSVVFAEIKKKYDRVVYKRRIKMTEKEAMEYLTGGECRKESQISHEIDWFLKYYTDIGSVNMQNRYGAIRSMCYTDPISGGKTYALLYSDRVLYLYDLHDMTDEQVDLIIDRLLEV